MALVQTQKLERPPVKLSQDDDTAPLSLTSSEVLTRALDAGKAAQAQPKDEPTTQPLPAITSPGGKSEIAAAAAQVVAGEAGAAGSAAKAD
jgi:hypothetical protein